MANAAASKILKLSKAKNLNKATETYSSLTGMFFFILETLHIIIKELQ